MVERKYIDVNIFVYWLAGHPAYGDRARYWISEVERARRGEYLTSSLTLYETAVIIAGLTNMSFKDKAFIERLLDAITQLKGLDIVKLEVKDYMEALNLMDKYRLDLEDSIHLATALNHQAKIIISNDNDFDKTPIKRIF